VFDWVLNSVFVQDINGEQRLIYFIRKVLQGVESCYQKLEKSTTLAIVFIVRRLRYYFQNYKVEIKIDMLIRKMFQKIDVVERMMKWSVELWEYSLSCESRGPVKA